MSASGQPAASPGREPLRRAAEGIDRLKTLVLWTITLGALAAFLCLVVREVRTVRTVVEPIAVPESLRAQGYTPEVMSTMLIDRIADMTRAAVDRKERQAVAAGWRAADVVVPTLNISLASTAGLFENLFEMPDTRISGEVVREPGEAEAYRLTLRVSAAADGWQVIEAPAVSRSRGWAKSDPIAGLVEQPAQALLLRIDPLSAASYAYVRLAEGARDAEGLGDRYERGPIVEAINRCLDACTGQDRATAYALWANLLARAAQLNEDPALLAEAVEKFGHAARAGTLKSDDRTRWADALIELGRADEGLAMYDEAARLHGDDFLMPYNRGMRLKALGRYEEAATSFARAAELGPGREWTHWAWGDTLLRLERWSEAEVQFRTATMLDGGIAPAFRGLAEALQRQGRGEEARRMLARADRLEPAPAAGTPVSLRPPPSPPAPPAG
jgi:tetratricopeptide (TPR) repeat protein